MDSPGYIVLSRLVAQDRATSAIAHNIANADTPGFQAVRPVFGEVLERQRAVALPSGGRDLHFARDRATWRETAPGPMTTTGNPLDLALPGEGFFAVETPRGERYTRAGRFTLDPEGRITDQDGQPVLSTTGQPIRLAPGDTRIEVLGDGTVRTQNGPVGQLRLVRFEDAQRLTAEGDRLLAAPADMPAQPVERPRVVQGAVEGSNVRPVLEFTRLTEGMRQFQFASQMVEREGERLDGAIDRILRRR